MSQFHRDRPELAGTDQDPWMQHQSYRDAMRTTEHECPECGEWRRFFTVDGICTVCDARL